MKSFLRKESSTTHSILSSENPFLQYLKIDFMKYILSLVLLFITGQSFALAPSREYKVKPDKYGMVYREEKVGTKDGASLNAWFFVAPKHVTNWIVISGSGDGNMADDLELTGQFL